MSRYFLKDLYTNRYILVCTILSLLLVYDYVFESDIQEPDEHITAKECTQTEDQNLIPEIPKYMFGYIDDIVKEDKFEINCNKEKVNFVYGKTHKCASDTLSAVWRRFALSRNLSIVIPILGKFLLGWPHPFENFMHRPAKHEWGYNILLDHVVFDYSYISTIMPSDTVYFTTVREPFGRLGSALSYHGMGKCGRMKPGIDVGAEFLKDMFWYDNLYKSPDNMLNLTGCKCVPKGVSIARNAMAFDLGFPTGWHFNSVDQQDNYTYIKEWLKRTNKEFNLILPIERFNEAMILLKRYMCWSFKDIIFRRLRYNKNRVRAEFQESDKHMFRKWSNVDTLLYYMANKTFDKRVKPFGQDFQDEVEEYERQEVKVLDFCEFESKPENFLEIEETKWDSSYTMSHDDCLLLMDKQHNRDRVKEQYDQLNGDYSTFPIHLGYNLGTYC